MSRTKIGSTSTSARSIRIRRAASWIRGGTRAQVSVGRLNEPDVTEPGDVTRLSASIEHAGLLFDRETAITVGWGQNREAFATENGYLAEMTWRLWRRGTVYGRGEIADKHIIGAGGRHPPGTAASARDLHRRSPDGRLLARTLARRWPCPLHRRRHLRLPRPRGARGLIRAASLLPSVWQMGGTAAVVRWGERRTKNEERRTGTTELRTTERSMERGTVNEERGTERARCTRNEAPHAEPGTKHRTGNQEPGTRNGVLVQSAILSNPQEA